MTTTQTAQAPRRGMNFHGPLVPHWEAAIDGKVFDTVTAPDREAARARAASRLFEAPTAQQVQRITIRYLSNR